MYFCMHLGWGWEGDGARGGGNGGGGGGGYQRRLGLVANAMVWGEQLIEQMKYECMRL